MYAEKYQASLEKVAQKRAENIALEPARMTAEQKETLLKTYHPDYKEAEFSTLKVGPNKGDKVPHELCETLQAHSRITADSVDLTNPDYDCDVLVIGAGGAGTSAAIEAHEAGANVLVVTKLRMKCGVGKCGRCNVGAKYVCKDGPVFRCDEIDALPDEY